MLNKKTRFPRFLALVAMVVLGLATAAGAYAQEKVAIRKELPPGRYLMEQDFFFSQADVKGTTSTVVRQKAHVFWHLEVSGSSTDRLAVLKLQNIAFNMRGPSGEERSFGYDRSQVSDASSAMRDIYDHLLGLAAQVHFDANLNPVDISGVDEWRDFLAGDPPADDAEARLAFALLRNLISPDMMKGYFNQLFYLLPRNPVALGDQWVSESKPALPVQSDIDMRWDSRLTGLEGRGGDRIAIVTGTGKITMGNTQVNCSAESNFRLRTGLPFSVSFNSIHIQNFDQSAPADDAEAGEMAKDSGEGEKAAEGDEAEGGDETEGGEGNTAGEDAETDSEPNAPKSVVSTRTMVFRSSQKINPL